MEGDDMRKEEALGVFLWVFGSTSLAIFAIYFIGLAVYHCFYWPKRLANIKRDRPMQMEKQQKKLRELAVARDRRPPEDKTQSERSETPIARTQDAEEEESTARPARPLLAASTAPSENASLVGDFTPPSDVLTELTPPPAPPSPEIAVKTAKEQRKKAPPKRWFEDDMLTTGVETVKTTPPRKPRPSSETKDQKEKEKDKKDKDKKDKDKKEKDKKEKAPKASKDESKDAKKTKPAESKDPKKPKVSESKDEKRTKDQRKWKDWVDLGAWTGAKGPKTRIRRGAKKLDDVKTCVEQRPLLNNSSAKSSARVGDTEEKKRRRGALLSGSWGRGGVRSEYATLPVESAVMTTEDDKDASMGTGKKEKESRASAELCATQDEDSHLDCV